MSDAPSSDPTSEVGFWERVREVVGLVGRSFVLVWNTSRPLTCALAVLTLVAGVLPAAVAWLGKQIVDGVLLAAETGLLADRNAAIGWVVAEGCVVVVLAATRRAIDVCSSLLRAELGNEVNVLILRKALRLTLSHFEDSEVYDLMTRARRQASRRPLSLVKRAMGLVQNAVSLVTYGAILVVFSPWAVAGLAVAALPSFFAETRFAGQAYSLFSWRSPDVRMQGYLEVVVAREDHAKEVKLLGIGPALVDRYDRIFRRIFGEERSLMLRRGFWAMLLGALSTAALYSAYGWIAATTVAGVITLGQMTMYLLVFKQGQGALSASLRSVGGIYEDSLYMRDLYRFLHLKIDGPAGAIRVGTAPQDGVRFENVRFRYPGAESDALSDVTLHIPAGTRLALVGHNGSGKTTLIKLLTGLYRPTDGRILIDGVDVNEWDAQALRDRMGVIFQDFVKYQLSVGENIGVGDREHMMDVDRQRTAADKGMAADFIESLPDGFETQLGRWFQDGRELSIGQWQKVALGRAFMRTESDILVLDEPTSAMDAEAEAQIFDRVRELTSDQIAILISHRFSTVRMADRIVVMEQGRVVESGSHGELMSLGGRYSQLFSLQAEGYR